MCEGLTKMWTLGLPILTPRQPMSPCISQLIILRYICKYSSYFAIIFIVSISESFMSAEVNLK